jgi:hypothetical protein
MLSIRSVFSSTAVLSFLCSNVALAGPVERMAEVAVHPSNPDIMVLSYVNGGTGLLFTADGGHEFRLLCSAGIANSKPEGPVAITNDGRVLLAEFDTLWQDSGGGCGWSGVPQVSGRWLTDFALHPSDPSRIFSVSANGGVRNGLVRRDAADQWVDVGSRDELGISRLRVTKMGSGLRFYESALRVPDLTADAGSVQPTYLIRVSDDEGQSWREHEVSFENGGAFRLEAVDPTNPDRIVAVVARENKPDNLLLSRDQGRTFEPYLEVSDLGGFTMAPDGRVWIGEPASISSMTASRGLWFAANLDAKPTKVAEFGVECLVYQPKNQSLLACQASSFGKVDTTSWEYTQYSHFASIKDFVSCSDKSMAQVCEQQLCADYCAAMHFARAPLCCAYNTSSCGRVIAMMEGAGPEMCMSAADGGMPVAGKAGSPAAGSSAAAGGAGVKSPQMGPDDDGDGGCGCRALGAQERSPLRLSAIPLLLLVAAIRRRLTRKVPNKG